MHCQANFVAPEGIRSGFEPPPAGSDWKIEAVISKRIVLLGREKRRDLTDGPRLIGSMALGLEVHTAIIARSIWKVEKRIDPS